MNEKTSWKLLPVACLSVLALAACSSSSDDDASGDDDSSDDGSPDDPELADIVKLHNAVRDEVGQKHLVWSNDAAAVAKDYANQCTFAHNPDRHGYGENIYASSAGSTAKAVVDSWAAEKPNYDPSTGACSGGECGHYTQIVWSTTTAVGCAKASCTKNSPFGSGSWDYWVCDYDPPGNYSGQKAY